MQLHCIKTDSKLRNGPQNFVSTDYMIKFMHRYLDVTFGYLGLRNPQTAR